MGNVVPDSAQTYFSPPSGSVFENRYFPLGGVGALRHHNHGGGKTRTGPFHGKVGHFGKVKRDLRNENDIGGARQPSVKRDPTGVAAHGFHHHDPLVGPGGGVEPVEAVDHTGNG